MSKTYDVPVFGNPIGGKKAKSRTGQKPKEKNVAKKGKKGKKNPLSLGGAKSALKHGVALGLGAVLAREVANYIPLPQSLTGGGIAEAAASAGVAYGAGMLAKKVKVLAPYADSIRDGGIALAVYKLAAPTLLPMLAFTDNAKAKAQVDAQGYNLIALAKANVNAIQAATGQSSGTPSADQGTGDAFVLSRGGITTADRAPRDTTALAGVGDAYAKERPGFSGGAPNRIRGPWSRSIYAGRN